MTGFEPRASGIGSNCSTNWATTTAPEKLRSDDLQVDEFRERIDQIEKIKL